MGMSTFGLMILLCLLSVCTLVNSASILENSNDLSWQNWLLNENEEIPSQQSSPLSRRITPKSVFVAPAFSRCSEGYRLDAMGNCVEIVKINELAQWESVLERLKQQMNAQQYGFNKRQSQRNDSNSDSGGGGGGGGGEKINRNKASSTNTDADLDSVGPFQLSIPFNSKNSSENQWQNDTVSSTAATITTITTTTTVSATSTEKQKLPMENPITGTITRSTTVASSPVPRTTTVESWISQNTHFIDYTTDETTDAQELTTFGGIDYQEDTEANQYNTESSLNTEATIADSTTQDTVTESILNVASHFADFDKINDDATEITTQVVRRTPNYNSIVPLKGVVVNAANTNVEQIQQQQQPFNGGGDFGIGGGIGGGLANFKPFASYTASKLNANNYTDVNKAKNPIVHIVNSLKNNKNEDVVEGESTNIPGDVFQKLPPNERTKPKCDSTNKYDCLLPINIFPTNKPTFLLNRKPSSTAFVRFPETPTKSYVRFPPQKVPIEYDDVALAESNPGYRYWDRRYPSTWWTSWKSKPQFIQIVPETSAIYGVGDVNYIRSHPHFPTQTEWYNK